MGKRGPRAAPTALKRLRGNPGHRPLPPEEPEPAVCEPAPPEIVAGLALAEWNRLCPELRELGMMTALDRTCLAMYCYAYGEFLKICRRLKRETPVVTQPQTGNTVINPLVRAQKTYADICKSMMVEMGFTPSSRSRVTASGKEKEPDSRLQEFFRRHGKRMGGELLERKVGK